MAKFLPLLVLGAACATAQTVEGRVFDAATGSGIGGAKVRLEKQTLSLYETTTDANGRFRFDNVSEGDYSIRYVSPGYWLTAGSSDYRVYHVAAGNPLNLDARLMPWSKISGRVVDGAGNGVADARLDLTGSGMVANGRTYLRTSWGGGGGGQLSDGPLALPFKGLTDANGRFEVEVMPSAYGLAVIPPPDLKAPDPGEGGLVLAWTRTYYPGVAVADAASKIVVSPGGEVSGIELKLVAIPAHAVRGVVLNPDGTTAGKVAIAHAEESPSASVELKADGTFEFPIVTEGEWRITAVAQKGSVWLRATDWIDVGKHDVENVKLRLAPPVTLRGRVAIEAPKDAPAPRLGPVSLSRRGGRTGREDDMDLGAAAVAIPDAKGDFTFQAYPGAYRVGPLFMQLPPPYYLDAILIGVADLTMQDVEISFDAAVTVVYKTDGGSVRGKAENCASGGVVLVPGDPSRRRPVFSRSAGCDSNGNYEVDGVRPGDYYALAFAGNGPMLKIDDALLNQAVKVSVRTGETSSADLRAITKPVY